MPQYVLSVCEEPGIREAQQADIREISDAVSAVVQAIMDAGIFVFAGGLHESETASVVRPDGIVTDGPYVEAKESMGGFTIIDVPDRETALSWAKRMAAACRLPQEVRQFHTDEEFEQIVGRS